MQKIYCTLLLFQTDRSLVQSRKNISLSLPLILVFSVHQDNFMLSAFSNANFKNNIVIQTRNKFHTISVYVVVFLSLFSDGIKGILKWYYDQKITFIFLRISKLCLLNTPHAKF